MKSKLSVCALFCACCGAVWLMVRMLLYAQDLYSSVGGLTTIEYSWLFRLLLNCAGYVTVLAPGAILYKYLEKTNYFDRTAVVGGGDRCVGHALYVCFGEPDERLPETVKPKDETKLKGVNGIRNEVLHLVICCSGLMGSYLVWGLLQEKIMTQNYSKQEDMTVRFHDSQFLVFINRLSAFCIALIRLACTHTPVHAAPLYKYSYCSFTNIMSAWCQYEALKYVSFPTQVLSKSCKVIPVMLMGKAVSGNKYQLYEYVTAMLISVGMVLFMFGSTNEYTASTVTTLSGCVLLALYMACDSFTSSWQGELFHRYQMTPVQMMCGVNLFSCLFTGASLLQQPASYASFNMVLEYPVLAVDCALLSASSAVGQLFIYHTIAHYGAVVFTIIMTLRQALSILLSCLVYGHYISVGGVFGVGLVFTAVLLRLYCRQRLRSVSRRPAPNVGSVSSPLRP